MVYLTPPILCFKNYKLGVYNIGVLRILQKDKHNKENKLLIYNDNKISPRLSIEKFGKLINLYDIYIDTKKKEKLEYFFNDENIKYEIHIPLDPYDIRIFYYSCNDKKNSNIWDKVLKSKSDYNLMLGGGDQIYADDIFELPKIKEIIEKIKNDISEFTSYICDDNVKIMIDEFYFNLYIEYMNLEYYRDMLSSIPSINIWDDHEIFDGFGSYCDQIQNCDLVKTIFHYAEYYFLLFQKQTIKDEHSHINNTKIYKIEDTCIIALDNRSERTRNIIMSEHTIEYIEHRLENMKCKNLFVMVGVPLVFPYINFPDELVKIGDVKKEKGEISFIKKLLFKLGGENQFGSVELIDDLVYDSWHHDNHLGELEQIIEVLVDFQERNPNSRITVLAGDSHLGGLSEIIYAGIKINHIMSSGIGSIFDNDEAYKLFNKMALCDIKKRDYTMRYIPIDGNYFVNKRNWLEIKIKNNKILSYLNLESGEKLNLNNNDNNENKINTYCNCVIF
jgi:hypothetical protein